MDDTIKEKQKFLEEEETERDRLIYEFIFNIFRLESQRTITLDGKASGIIGFVGIILSLQGGLGGFLLSELPRNFQYGILSILFFIGILLLMLSIFCGLKAYNIKTWKAAPEPEHLIEEYGKKDRSRIDILRIVSKELSESYKHNYDINNKKAKSIKHGFVFLTLGIIFVIAFIGLLLIAQ